MNKIKNRNCVECGKTVGTQCITLQGEYLVHLECFTPYMPKRIEYKGVLPTEEEEAQNRQVFDDAVEKYLKDKKLK